MIRMAVVKSIFGILILSFILGQPVHPFARFFFGLWGCIQFISLSAFGFSGIFITPDGAICFTKRCKQFVYSVSHIAEIQLSGLSWFNKYGFIRGRGLSPDSNVPVLTFCMVSDYGQYIKYKVFVNTFKKDGEELQAFLCSLHELNPTLIIPDVKAFNATLK